MKKINFSLLLVISILFSLCLYANENLSICLEQCKNLKGIAKSNCIATCTRTKKRNSKTSKQAATKKQFSDCEEICKVFKGLKNVQCMRTCLDRIKVKNRHDPTAEENYSPACQKRCKNMPEKLKYKCLLRCKKYEEKKPTRKKQSVW